VSAAGPGTSWVVNARSHSASAHTTRLVDTIAPQSVATSTSRHGSFSLRSSRRMTSRPKAVVGTQARAQAAATPGPASSMKM